MQTSIPTAEKAASQSLAFFQFLLSDYHPRNFAIRLWDGNQWSAETASPRVTLLLQHPGAVRRMFQTTTTDLALAEAYIYDDIDIVGDIEAVFALADYFQRFDWNVARRLRAAWQFFRLPTLQQPRRQGRQAATLSAKPHSLERDRQAIAYHYDVANEFYALWLDPCMVYSCAYFTAPDEALETAQTRKLDYVCRKLRLQPGERLLDIGCGWGGLVMHAVRHYGVEALGITLSRPQADWATERIRHAGLGDHCRVEACDYRELHTADGFDKLVSVGMFEHVGEALLPVYFQQAFRLLRPGGAFLNHGIGVRTLNPPKSAFIDRYVFPDSELLPIHTTLRYAEEAGFEVRDVENLREHYALTLRHWVRRLEAHHEDVVQVSDEPTYRVWRLFMAGSAYGFTVGRLHLYQTLLVKPAQGDSGLPLTRADWYTPSP